MLLRIQRSPFRAPRVLSSADLHSRSRLLISCHDLWLQDISPYISLRREGITRVTTDNDGDGDDRKRRPHHPRTDG